MGTHKKTYGILLAVIGVYAAGCTGSGVGFGGGQGLGSFAKTALVSDQAGQAPVTDPNLVNAWGIAESPNGPFWVADNGTGVASVYNTTGVNQGFTVGIPAMAGGAHCPVSGQAFNGTTDFMVNGSPALFIFDSEDGVISGWNAGANAVAMVDRSATGTVYKGLAIGNSGGSNFLFATDFNHGNIDIFDSSFAFVKSVNDPGMPSGFAPFGIANIGGTLFVSFAKQDGAKHDDVKGPGLGFVDQFRTDGTLIGRFASQGKLNSPWAMVQAPSGFGNAGGDILVGNFGDGTINVFDTSGGFMGQLSDSTGAPLMIDGLWGLIFGNGGSGGLAGTLYFTSGPQGESHGLFGSVSVQSAKKAQSSKNSHPIKK